MKEKSRKIEDIRKEFRKKREWLLIAVEKTAATIPLTGRLLAHSPHKNDILKKSISSKNKDLLIDYSEDTLPKDVALIFPIHKNDA